MTRSALEGIVIALARGQYEVQTDRGVFVCSLRGKLRKELVRPLSKNVRPATVMVRTPKVTDVVAVGDRVEIVALDARAGVIERVLPRDSGFTRRAAGAEPLAQTMLAGLDQLVAVFAVREPEPHLRMLDRILVTTEAAAVPTVICINKVDLGVEGALADALAIYQRIGYRVIFASTRTGQGLAELRAVLTGVTSAFVGPSGVGKSSLINGLMPGAGLAVGGISAATGKGRHTTRSTRLLPLGGPDDGQIADTAGLRAFALWEIDPETVAEGFVELRPYLGQCRFSGCTHVHEPGCAVRAAVGATIDPRRYASYVALRTGQAE
ncbi:MAG: ribosome small subunit-dependent GTPase A [Chloroflexi bacterium]|nr:ribosome small subunit-dependent GTPase A [Chloroflexota bacterium]